MLVVGLIGSVVFLLYQELSTIFEGSCNSVGSYVA